MLRCRLRPKKVSHRYASFPQLRRNLHALPLQALAGGGDQHIRRRGADEATGSFRLSLHLILQLKQHTTPASSRLYPRPTV